MARCQTGCLTLPVNTVCSGTLVDFGVGVGRAWVSGKDFTEGNVVRVDPNFRSDLAKRIEKARGRKLPGFMNFDVFSTLVCECLQCWERPTLKFQHTMDEALKDFSESVVNFHVSNVSKAARPIREDQARTEKALQNVQH